ncbi:hypothetical protein QYM36_003345, partial [Artemia franciscana]
ICKTDLSKSLTHRFKILVERKSKSCHSDLHLKSSSLPNPYVTIVCNDEDIDGF